MTHKWLCILSNEQLRQATLSWITLADNLRLESNLTKAQIQSEWQTKRLVHERTPLLNGLQAGIYMVWEKKWTEWKTRVSNSQ